MYGDRSTLDTGEHGAAPEETTQEGDETAPELTESEREKIASFQEVGEMSVAAQAKTLAAYGHLDPKNEIPDQLLERAVLYFDANKKHIDNQAYLTVVDFATSSKYSRFFVINMTTGSVWKIHVAHGSGSDSNNDGIAERFSNTSGSKASSVGYYRAAETYSGKHGLSLRLDGLSASNSKVRSRAIVIHGASYVYDSDRKPGRSWGCFAVSNANKSKLISMLKNGSILYADR